MQKPNILVVLTDQQTWNAMSCAGNRNLYTPAMDSLAARGVRFDRTYCTFPLCMPSRASLFSGLYPHQVGMTGNANTLCADYSSRSLGRIMTDAGYDCGYGGKWHVTENAIPDQVHGFRKISGFDDLKLPGACDSFLREKRDKPFFLVASFDNPHNICEYGREEVVPWVTLPEEPRLSEMPNLPANFAVSPFESFAVRHWRQTHGLYLDHYTPELWRRYRWGYNRLVEAVDRQIGKILKSLDDLGLHEQTVIIFTSDHGDMQGAHQMGNKTLFYEESSRVPMIICPAGGVTADVGVGRVESRLVSNGIDLFPTVCDYAGIDTPAGLPGLSLRPLVEGRPVRQWREFVVAESKIATSTRMIRTERYKYTLDLKGRYREMLFDLETDPGEMVNLSVESACKPELQRHRDLLANWCRQTNDTFGGHYAHPGVSLILPGMGFGDEDQQA
jgi:arylsulfatase A-like enzyme